MSFIKTGTLEGVAPGRATSTPEDEKYYNMLVITATSRRTSVALPRLEGPSALYGMIGDFLSRIDPETDFLGFVLP